MDAFMFREVNNPWLTKSTLLVFVLHFDVASLHFRLFLGLGNVKYGN